MMDCDKLVKALRCCAENFGCPIECPRYSPADEGVRACVSRLEKDAAAAIEDLQAMLTEADKKQAYQHDYVCELVAEVEELKAQLPKRGKEFDECVEKGTKPDWCSFVCALPEKHGRLVDADAMVDDVKNLWDYATVDGITSSTVLKQVMTDIGNAPTIVPADAERSET